MFPDADPVRAAKGAAALKFLNAGQACISPNRLYVAESHADAFISTMTERVGAVRAGNGFAEGVGVGPLVNEAAVAKVEAQVDDAVAKGADALVGGHRLSEGEFAAGHFFAPTLLTGVDDSMAIYREETFGPVAPVITYGDVDRLIAELRAAGSANATPDRNRGLTGRNAAERFRLACAAQADADGRIPLTIEVIFGVAWTGEERRPGGPVEVPITALGGRRRPRN